MVDEKNEEEGEGTDREDAKRPGVRVSSKFYVAERDPDFMEAYNNLYTNGLGPGKALPVKNQGTRCDRHPRVSRTGYGGLPAHEEGLGARRDKRRAHGGLRNDDHPRGRPCIRRRHQRAYENRRGRRETEEIARHALTCSCLLFRREGPGSSGGTMEKLYCMNGPGRKSGTT